MKLINSRCPLSDGENHLHTSIRMPASFMIVVRLWEGDPYHPPRLTTFLKHYDYRMRHPQFAPIS